MKTVASKLPEQLADRIDTYADAHGLNRSQAMRQLLTEGLDATERAPINSTLSGFFILGVFLLGAGYASFHGPLLAPITALCLILPPLLTHETVRHELHELAREAGWTDNAQGDE